MEFIDVLAILGYFLRLLGALVFGVAAGWLVLQAIKPETLQALQEKGIEVVVV